MQQVPRALAGARRRRRAACAAAAVAALLGTSLSGGAANASTAPTLNLRVLLIGGGSGDPTTNAWESALSSEGVAYTEADGAGALGSQTVALPALTSGTTGQFNGVVFADSPGDFAASQLTALDSYEATYGVRQIDGYIYPGSGVGLTAATDSGPLDGTTGQLTAAGLAALPELKGPVPFDTGTYGFPATVNTGAAFTPWLDNGSGQVMAGVYQHPATDPQANVAELELSFNYNASQLQWLLLAPGLVNWVTNDAHLGLYRNYFGQDVDDFFIADNEWSQQYQCTPAAVDPTDSQCPPAVQGNPADGPPDTQMSAADVAYVANWEKQSGITLEFAFNGIGACTAPLAADESKAKCTGSTTVGGATYTDPGQDVDSGYPNDSAFVNALLTDQGDFNWITHTWSHLFLGCEVWQPLAVNPASVSASGSLAAGSYSYEVTAATAYGESEPSVPLTATLGSTGSVALSWPDASNGGGPSLSALESEFSGGTGFWGYNVYRAPAGSTDFGLVGQVAENPAGGTSTYSFTDTGAQAPAGGPSSSSAYPTATDPGTECAGANGADWVPASSATPDSSIDQEIGLDDAFAKANGFTNFSTSAVVTGEHSGLENPNMPTALSNMGITTFAADGSRQPAPYSIAYPGGTGSASSAPREPSNIYYNADNWPDEINEYNSLYVASGDSIGNAQFPTETGHCGDTASTTCLSTPATESGILASESRILLGHVLDNNPRVGYAHQSNLIGPATQPGQTTDYGYTLISLLNDMLAQYNSWYTAPLSQVTDATESQVLAEQAAWAAAQTAGHVSATETGGVITVTNGATGAVTVPITAPPGSLVNGVAFGQSYGGALSAWVILGAGGSTAVSTPVSFVAPAFTSAASVTGSMLAGLNFTITTSGYPTATVTESGSLPLGLTFTAGANGTAKISGAPVLPGSTKITLTATSPAGTVTQSFTITVNLLLNLTAKPGAPSSATPGATPTQ